MKWLERHFLGGDEGRRGRLELYAKTEPRSQGSQRSQIIDGNSRSDERDDVKRTKGS